MRVPFCHRQIGEIVEDVASWNPIRDEQNRLIRYIDLSSVDQYTKAIHPNEPIAAREASSRARQLVQTDDVLVSTVRPNLNGVAKVSEALDGATASTGFCVLRPKRSALDSGYLFHWVKAPTFIGDMVRKATGASYPAVSDRIVLESQIPLPPLTERRRIAAILDQAEVLRAKRRHALTQLDTLTRSLFLDLFGSQKFPEESIGDLLASGDLLRHKDGNHGSLYPRADDFGETGIPFLSAKAITDDGGIDEDLVERLREDKASQLRIGWIASGDVLLAHNASVGKVALYDGRFEKALIGTSLTTFRPNPARVDSQFLAAALRSPMFQRQLEKNMGQTTRNQVPITAQRELCIIAPPLPLQREFAAQVLSVERLKAAQRTSLAKLDALFASLQHRAFRGEL